MTILFVIKYKINTRKFLVLTLPPWFPLDVVAAVQHFAHLFYERLAQRRYLLGLLAPNTK